MQIDFLSKSKIKLCLKFFFCFFFLHEKRLVRTSLRLARKMLRAQKKQKTMEYYFTIIEIAPQALESEFHNHVKIKEWKLTSTTSSFLRFKGLEIFPIKLKFLLRNTF